MIGAVAPGRLRSLCAVLAVAGMLFSLFALCCCSDDDPGGLPGAGATVGVVALQVAQDGMTDAAGLADQDCARSATSEAARSTSSAGVAAVAIPTARATMATAPVSAIGLRLSTPVPHLLCVMRT